MPSKLNPYINFNGNSREAMEFYKTVFGGTLTTSTYKEGGMPHDPSEANKLMHAMLVADNGITLMAADIPDAVPHKAGTNVSISLSGDNEKELTGYWEKLSADANIREPLKKAPWGDTFGMLADKFGIEWMVNILGKKQ
jgi:PhnB protein